MSGPSHEPADGRRALAEIVHRLDSFGAQRPGMATASARRAYMDALRDALRLYADAVRPQIRSGGDALDAAALTTLKALAARALNELGGEAEWPARSLRDYDHVRFGPYLGVSGEGSASVAIRDAALSSPKVVALGLSDPLEVGVAHDAERLGSVGELPVGPDEYRDIRLECVGRILTSTNVGSRLNVRFYGKVSIIWVNRGPADRMLSSARQSATDRFAPFLAGPDGRPRPVTAFVRFRGEVPREDRRAVLIRLAEDVRSGLIGSPGHHRLGLLAGVHRGIGGVQEAIDAMDLAREAGVGTVAIEGTVREAAEQLVSMPGLLNYFSPNHVRRLNAEAASRGIVVGPANVVDTDSVARQVWTALVTARNMGLELGKYGLFPLSFEESERVIQLVQSWFPTWTAAPVFYVDQPTARGTEIFERAGITTVLPEWLAMVARHGVPVVLVDTAEKSRGLRMLKSGPRDGKGILTSTMIRELDQAASRMGIRALWAGGITAPQAYEFGRMGVFGVYVTTAVASAIPVGPEHETDPALAAERLPTREGVARVKLLLEAGFLSSKLQALQVPPLAAALDPAAQTLLRALATNHDVAIAERHLWDLTAAGWRAYHHRPPPSVVAS